MDTIIKPDGTEIDIQKPIGVSPTVEERIRVLEYNQKNIIAVINEWSNMLSKLIANSNQIYPQIDTSYHDNNIHIRASKNIINSSSIILVLPTESIEQDGNNIITNAELVIHSGGNKFILPIVKEDYNGNIVGLVHGDIVSNRLAVFRIDQTTGNRVILCHALSFDSIGINKLTCNEAVFNSLPKINLGNGKYETVLSAESSAKITEDLDQRYQKKIIFGDVPPNEYINKNYLEEGQIYIQQEK